MWPYLIVRLLIPIYFLITCICYVTLFTQVVFGKKFFRKEMIYYPFLWPLLSVTRESRTKFKDLME